MQTTKKRKIIKSSVVTIPLRQKSIPFSEVTLPTVVADQDVILNTARAHSRAIALQQAAADKVLFNQWREEDATDDSEELNRRDQETLQLQLALNANRRETGERVPFPELDENAAPGAT